MSQSEPTEVDVETMMREVRERVRAAPVPLTIGAGPGTPTSGLDGWNVTDVTFVSDRRFTGRLVSALKRLVRRLLTPILQRQVDFNVAVARALTAASDRLGDEAQQLRGAQGQLRERAQAMAQWQTAVQQWQRSVAAWQHSLEGFQRDVQRWNEGSHERHGASEARLSTLESSHRSLAERTARAERQLRRRNGTTSDGTPPRTSSAAGEHAAPAAPAAEFDYVGFEDRHRGDEAEITERQRRYVDLFRGAEPVLDVGCGRGEFLELLKDAGIRAAGVDSCLDMTLLCQEKGLRADCADALVHLGALRDGSLGGVFSGQFVEHLPPKTIVAFVRLVARKLRPGGVLVIETPNPCCLSVFARGFYLDFSHVWPCHPEAMRYLLEGAGFQQIEVLFSSPVDAALGLPMVRNADVFGEETERFNKTATFLNQLLLGCQDYAVVGRLGATDG